MHAFLPAVRAIVGEGAETMTRPGYPLTMVMSGKNADPVGVVTANRLLEVLVAAAEDRSR